MLTRIIGDIHQRTQDYHPLTNTTLPTIQTGDLAFDYPHILKGLDPTQHKFFGGNHDNYHDINNHPHCLGNHGPINNTAYFIRGAWSIDQKIRTPGHDWYPEEQLTTPQLLEAIEEWTKLKPHILLTHEAPTHILPILLKGKEDFAYSWGHTDPYIKTRTGQALDTLYLQHKPEIHIFGHYHTPFDNTINGVRYICLTADTRYQKPGTLTHIDLNIE